MSRGQHAVNRSRICGKITVGRLCVFVSRRIRGAGVHVHWRNPRYRPQVGVFLPGGYGVTVYWRTGR